MSQRQFCIRLFIALFALQLSGFSLLAQDKYWVFFKDKDTTSQFNPLEYFDGKAIQRRLKNGVLLNDTLCWPLNLEYVHKVKAVCDSVNQESRWLNAISIYARPSQLSAIRSLEFVRKIRPIYSIGQVAAINTNGEYGEDVALIMFQTQRMQGNDFRDAGLTGEGIRIAVFDAGFRGVKGHPAFEHLAKNNKILATYDFIHNRENVYFSSSHGTAVLSCIAGKCEVPDEADSFLYIGLAQDAEFLLAKTERGYTEFISEEDNWIAAVEWADRLGADIISSSLGYTNHRYFNFEMDGQTALLSIAANMAASRGILVINAAGNEGESVWRTVASPADADSVLAVGAINPYEDIATSFSSLGPAADGRLKPNVSAIGISCVAVPNGYAVEMGTSFAAPLVTGFAACAWQHDTALSNMQLFHLLEQSGHLYPYYDLSHGYGVPQAGFFIGNETALPPTVEMIKEDASISISITGELAKLLTEEGPLPKKRNLYYKIETPSNKIKRYGAIRVESLEPLRFEEDELSPGDKITIHFEGYTTSLIY